jgi:deoxyribonuclease-1
MKKIISLLVLFLLTATFSYANTWSTNLTNTDTTNINTSIEPKLQKKIDTLNEKLEIIYKKSPSTILKLQKQIKKILPKLKADSTNYYIVTAINSKIEELLSQKEEIKKNTQINSWNTFNDSFNKAKQYLEEQVYNNIWLQMITFYCSCNYDSSKNVDRDSCGFKDNWKYVTRSKKIEWEHVVPAEAFWQSFIEWREWAEDCVDSKWKTFKWRGCAEKVNMEYRYMQSDMYNLVPAIGSINALRSNYSYAEIPWEEREFWTCDMEIQDSKAEPREEIRWDVARTYFYMNTVYPGHSIISWKNQKLYEAWDKLDPVSDDECKRYELIKAIQQNENPILKDLCI